MKRYIITILFVVGWMVQASAQVVGWKERPAYQSVVEMGGPFWKVQSADGKWQLRNEETVTALTEWFDSIAPFRENSALLMNKDDGKWKAEAIYSKTNNIVMKVKTDCYVPADPYFSCGLMVIENAKGDLGYMRIDGSVGVKPKFNTAYPFREGVALVADKKGKQLFIDGNGKKLKGSYKADDYIIYIMPDNIAADGLYSVYTIGGKSGFKMKDDIFIPAQFDKATLFQNSIAAVAQNGKWGFVKVMPNSISGRVVEEKKDDFFEVTLSEGLNKKLVDVSAVTQEGGEQHLNVDSESPSLRYTLGDIKGDYDIVLKYDGIVHQTVHKKGAAVKPVVSETKGELVIASVGKRGKKADKNDKEYIDVRVKNTSSKRLTATVTIYVDGKPYASKVTVNGKGTKTATATIEVKSKERLAKVYATLSNGQRSKTQSIMLKPYY